MLKKLTFALALLSAPGLSFAADLAVPYQPALKAPPMPQPFSWTGFYAGLNVGGAFDNSDRVNASGLGAASVALRNKSDGVTAGGQFGYNYEFPLGGLSGVVLGLETDAAYTDLGAGSFVPGSTVQLGGRMNFLGTVRGKVGYAFDRYMVYATGGFAYGNIDHSSNLGGLGSASLSTTETGFTYGAGFEYALPVDPFFHMSNTSAVTLRVEYLRYVLDDNRFNAVLPTTAVAVKLKDVGNIARVGVNYKF